jgi:hypothetical protein
MNFPIKTIKEKNKSKGLDFTKTVIINDLKYLSKQPARINQEEYLKLDKNRHFIEKKMLSYLKIYKKALQKPNTNKNQNILSKSTLQYFHKELNILFNENNID